MNSEIKSQHWEYSSVILSWESSLCNCHPSIARNIMRVMTEKAEGEHFRYLKFHKFNHDYKHLQPKCQTVLKHFMVCCIIYSIKFIIII
jgi:hypothetical protein